LQYEAVSISNAAANLRNGNPYSSLNCFSRSLNITILNFFSLKLFGKDTSSFLNERTIVEKSLEIRIK
jgi:hypothetical protein